MPRKLYIKRKRQTPASIARMAGLALLTGAVVYFMLAGGLGNYIARNFIIPNMQGGQPTLPAPTQPPGGTGGEVTPTPEAEATPAPAPTPVPEIVTEVFELPPLYFWSVQLGSFGNYKNAEALSNILRSRGAAGYIFTDAQGFARVLASSYTSREDALSVQTQLKDEQGMDSYVLEGGIDGAQLRLTAPRTDIEAVTRAYGGWAAIADKLPQLSYAMDKGEETPAGVLSAVTAMADELDALTAALPEDKYLEGTGSAAITGLKTLITDTASSLKALGSMDAAEPIPISSGLKYTHTDCLYRYTMYVMGITQQ